MRADMLERVRELRAGRTPFVVATVVRVAKPAVAITESAVKLETHDGDVYFCCPSCRDAFAADPGRYTRSL